jgi:NADH-quinone oxidoreductase subunit A
MTQVLFDPNAIIASVLVLSVGIGFGLIGYIISRLVAPPKPLPMKNERFECGNPPTKQGRSKLTMQYFAYLVIFLTMEPVFIYSFLLLMDAHNAFLSVVEDFSLILLMLIPPIIFGLDSAGKIQLWTMREDQEK